MGKVLRSRCGSRKKPVVVANTALLLSTGSTRTSVPQGIVDSCEQTKPRRQNHACLVSLVEDLALHLAACVHDGSLRAEWEGTDKNESGDLQQIQHRPSGRAFN